MTPEEKNAQPGHTWKFNRQLRRRLQLQVKRRVDLNNRKVVGWLFALVVIGILFLVGYHAKMESQSSNKQPRQNAATAAVTVDWTAVSLPTPGVTPEPGVISRTRGYNLYYGTTSRVYPNVIPTQATTVTVNNLPGDIPNYFAVTATELVCWPPHPPDINCATFEGGLSGELIWMAATPAPTTPTPTPMPTPPPLPTPTPSPSQITVAPTVINFTGLAGGANPAPQTITVTTSTGGGWTNFDTNPWCDAGPVAGISGEFTTLTPHTAGLAIGNYADSIKFSSAGLQNKIVIVNLSVTGPQTPTPLPTPPRTPTPVPTPIPVPTPALTPTSTTSPRPEATCTPCACLTTPNPRRTP